MLHCILISILAEQTEISVIIKYRGIKFIDQNGA